MLGKTNWVLESEVNMGAKSMGCEVRVFEATNRELTIVCSEVQEEHSPGSLEPCDFIPSTKMLSVETEASGPWKNRGGADSVEEPRREELSKVVADSKASNVSCDVATSLDLLKLLLLNVDGAASSAEVLPCGTFGRKVKRTFLPGNSLSSLPHVVASRIDSGGMGGAEWDR